MKLKRKITKAEFEALTEAQQSLYVVSGENYLLDVEPDDDVAALQRARDREKADAAGLREKLKVLQDAEDERKRAEEDKDKTDATKNKDLDKLQKIWESERESLKVEFGGKLTAREKQLQKLLVEDRAEAIARDLNPKGWKVLLPHIRARLTADLSGDELATKVVTEKGEPSTLSIEDLKKEFLNNPDFASIVVAVNSSGGGADRNNGGGASKKPSEYTEAERSELYRTNPEKFRQLFTPKN